MDGTRLFHVRGTNEFDTRAVQVEERASSLSSNDCFVLETPEATYIWYGKVSPRTLLHWGRGHACPPPPPPPRAAVVMSASWQTS